MTKLFHLFSATLLLGLSLSNPSFSAENEGNENYSFPFLVNAGTTAKITYKQTKGKNGTEQTGTVSASLEILDVTQNDLTATWSTNLVQVGATKIDSAHPSSASLFIDIPFKYTASPDGAPVSLYDREGFISSMVKSPIFSDYDPEILKQTTDMFRNMSDEQIAQTLIKVPLFMSLCHDLDLPLGESITSEGQIQVFSSAKPVTVKSKYTLNSVENGIASISYNLQFDADTVTEAVVDFIKSVNPDKQPTEQEISEIRVDRQDKTNCKVETTNGRVINMTHETNVSSSGQTQTEFYDIDFSWSE